MNIEPNHPSWWCHLFQNGSLLLQSDIQSDLISGNQSAADSTITDSAHTSEVISGSASGVMRITVCIMILFIWWFSIDLYSSMIFYIKAQ